MARSVLIPVKATLLNVLSLGVMFGAIVWIFQQGDLSGLLGFTPTGTLDASIPIDGLITRSTDDRQQFWAARADRPAGGGERGVQDARARLLGAAVRLGDGDRLAEGAARLHGAAEDGAGPIPELSPDLSAGVNHPDGVDTLNRDQLSACSGATSWRSSDLAQGRRGSVGGLIAASGGMSEPVMLVP
ncbi:hypothetical protein ACFXJ8_43425 [Nonomuraea sp. NPDC059194]|uniref:hypothetical protein n=1 Tax=Nonomuraea sp. NPDC059194 TaxID=3346764 RepID=UPI0036737BB7